jgi:cytidyltransferase-like protein
VQNRAKGSNGEHKEVRIFVEGAFDVMHYGHANAFRQARSLGTYLVAGVNSSESIEVKVLGFSTLFFLL